MPRPIVNVLLLHNPKAGVGDYDDEGLVRLFARHGHELVVHDSLAQDVPDLMHEGHDLVLIAGGDGTVADVLSVARGEIPPVSILPMGTANNLASAVGIDTDIASFAARLKDARPESLDIGLVHIDGKSKRFFESAGLGLFAEALGPVNAQQVESGQKMPQGREALIASLETMKPFDVHLEIDGESVDEQLLLVEAALLHTFGPRLHLAPHAGVNQRRLQVVIARESDRQRLLDWLRDDPEAAIPLPTRACRTLKLEWRDAWSHHDDHFLPPEPERNAWHLELDDMEVEVRVPRAVPDTAEND